MKKSGLADSPFFLASEKKIEGCNSPIGKSS